MNQPFAIKLNQSRGLMENNRLRFKIRRAYQADDITLAERLEAELMEVDPTYVPVAVCKPDIDDNDEDIRI